TLAAAGPTPRVSLELGRDRHAERLKRFLTFYDAATARLGPLTQIDLRYPNGFAARRQRTEDSGQKAARPPGHPALVATHPPTTIS
ncbi:MAG: hypothetical protein ACUVT2_01800, partial [Thiobacillaceae bacterium]